MKELEAAGRRKQSQISPCNNLAGTVSTHRHSEILNINCERRLNSPIETLTLLYASTRMVQTCIGQSVPQSVMLQNLTIMSPIKNTNPWRLLDRHSPNSKHIGQFTNVMLSPSSKLFASWVTCSLVNARHEYLQDTATCCSLSTRQN